jgi:hypothetical protein
MKVAHLENFIFILITPDQYGPPLMILLLRKRKISLFLKNTAGP